MRKSITVAIKQRALLGVMALSVIVGLSGLGTYALFTATTNVTQTNITTGTFSLSTPAAGTANRLTLGATSIVPGDTKQRIVDLTNSGGADMTAITLSTSATTSSLLDTDTTNGLQMVIDKCSVAWTESGVSPAFTYTCSGTTQSVLASRAIVGTNIALSNLTLGAGSSTDRLRFTLSLPTAAGNSLQGQSSAVTYTFTGTQRAGTNK